MRELIITELEKFLQFLLKNSYCDSDLYDESPTAIDAYLAERKLPLDSGTSIIKILEDFKEQYRLATGVYCDFPSVKEYANRIASLYSGGVSENQIVACLVMHSKRHDEENECLHEDGFYRAAKAIIRIANESHTTPEISEERIEEMKDIIRPFIDDMENAMENKRKPIGWKNILSIQIAKAAISKGEKPMSGYNKDSVIVDSADKVKQGPVSEGEMLLKKEALFNEHKVHKRKLIKYGLGLGEFLRALKGFNL